MNTLQKFVWLVFLPFMFIHTDAAVSSERKPLILPEYFKETAIKKTDKIEKKISGLLKFQVQLRKSYVKQSTPERLSAMKKMGMKTEEIDKHLVYVHAEKKLNASEIKSLKKMGVIAGEDSWIPPLKNHPTGFVIASMPVNRLYELAKKSFVVRLETAEKKLELKNDEAAESIYADSVWNLGYDGSGVRIAIIDGGLDTTHSDIPTPVASKDYSEYPDLDDSIEDTSGTGHGTHVTGSALGRGALSDGKYKGMAYGADLIFLKGRSDSGGFSNAALVGATKAAVDTYDADIINLSVGGFGKYNDGSSEDCQAVDYAFSKGALVFVSAGNEADDAIHYSGTVDAGYYTYYYIKINVSETSEASLSFYLSWFDGIGVSNDMDLVLYDENLNEVSDLDFVRRQEAESTRGTESESCYLNYDVAGPATFYLRVANYSSANQYFHIYSRDSNVTFEDADSGYTLGEPAVADNAIAVASYISRTEWVDYKGKSWNTELIGYTDDKIIGDISSFSSRGPRIDGTMKPDIAAPGQEIISVRDKVLTWPGDDDDYVIDNDGNNDGNGPADYYVMHGTSMASPIAAGAAALLLQAKPSLKGDPDAVRNALFQTGSNNGEQTTVSGYGRLDVQAALNYVTSTTPTTEGVVFGFVDDEDENPLKGVTVTIQGADYSDSAETDEDGYYEFKDLAGGEYTLTYEKDGYETQTKDVELEEGETLELETITLEEIVKGTIYGYVVDIQGEPIESVKLNLKGIKTGTKTKTSSDADGFFEFEDLSADTYIIFAKKKGYKKGKKTVTLEEGEEIEIEIEMKKTSRRILSRAKGIALHK